MKEGRGDGDMGVGNKKIKKGKEKKEKQNGSAWIMSRSVFLNCFYSSDYKTAND